MTLQVHIAPGHDVGYPWQGQAPGGRGGERTAGGYYLNAAQQREAPGRWFGRGAEALGFTAGQQVDREPYDAVYNQRHPQTGSSWGGGRALLGLGVTSPQLLARGAEIDQASQCLLIDAADELPPPHGQPTAALLNGTEVSAAPINDALAAGEPRAAVLFRQPDGTERDEPEPEL